MRIHLPEQITGVRDMLFVLDVQLTPAQVERRLEVVTQGALEALDLRGTGPGGSYVVPARQDQLHIPLRVTADGAGEASVELRCVEGPEQGKSERRTLRLTPAQTAAAAGGRSRLLLPLLALAALVGAGLYFGPKLLGGVKVPQLTGKKQTEAVRIAQRSKFRVRANGEDVTEEARDGIVLRQKPSADTKAKEGSEIELVVGRFTPALAEVPDLVGDSAENAEAGLRAVGFQPMITFRPAPTPAKSGKVLSQSPEAGERLEKDSVVELFVGRVEGGTPAAGPGDPDGTPPAVPAPADPAPALPEPPPAVPAPGVPEPPPSVPQPPAVPQPPVVPEPPPSVPAVPAPGERGVSVPDMKGLSKGDAEWKLAELGLMSEFKDTAADASMQGKVVSQTPAAGATVERLSTVVMSVGRAGGAATPAPGPVEPAPPAPPDPGPAVPPPPVAPEPGPAVPPVAPAPPAPPDPGPGVPPQAPEPPPVVPTQPVAPQPATQPPEVVQAGKVPDTIGLWREAAEGLIRRAGYRYQVVLRSTHDLEDGRVLGQQPAPGEALSVGQTVTLEIARTPVKTGVTVADVRGMDVAQALQALRDQGLVVRETAGGGSAAEQGKVVDQAPAPGTEVSARSWVEIVVARSLGTSPRALGGPPPSSSGLSGPPAVGPGSPRAMVNTPRAGVAPLPSVQLPSRDTPPSISTPGVGGQNARQAIDALLKAGLMPIVDIDRATGPVLGNVLRQTPEAGVMVRPGDLVRVVVSLGAVAGERSVTIPVASGAELVKAEQLFARMGMSVEVVEVSVPGHPYAGTGRVAAQYPVSTVSLSMGRMVTLWVVR